MKLIKDEMFHQLCVKSKLSLSEEGELRSIIAHIENHDEFQRRLTSEFPHHGEKTLGEHILTTAIVSYKMAKKRNVDLSTTLTIAMFHDLYTLPWQNSPIKNKNFSNYHGFRHPIEAIINSYIWFPDAYKDEKQARIIIDGIAHHMFPLPVAKWKNPTTVNPNPLELRNIELLPQVKEPVIELLTDTTRRGAIGPYSFDPADTKEGRIVCWADTIGSINDIPLNDIDSLMALLTGKNKGLARRKK
jgi:hypothetical protein